MSRIKDGDIVFIVNFGLLEQMVNLGAARDVTIPDILPNGERISAIGEKFCQGSYSSINISDDIKHIASNAFECADVRKVRWGKGCKVIPPCCFSLSGIEEIANIDSVTTIGKEAFTESGIEQFIWPSKCKEVPAGCFDGSALRTITNLQNVEKVGKLAFARTPNITKFTWPLKCKTIPEGCFFNSGMTEIENIENVNCIEHEAFAYAAIERMAWPKNCPEIPTYCFRDSKLAEFLGFEHIACIRERAFWGVNPSSALDMSNALIAHIDRGAFAEVDRKKVIFPYYTATEETEKALKK